MIQLMEMRLRLPELLDERGMTAYALAKNSAGRISEATAYRLVRQRGRIKTFDGDLLDALCDVLGVDPNDVLERSSKRKGK